MMTTNYPEGNVPAGPGDVPPRDDRWAWGCGWWWLLIIIILIFWWAGWGWGPYGGYWFRQRPVPAPAPTTSQPVRTGALVVPVTPQPPDQFLV